MNISFNWLSEFLKLDLKIDEVSNILTDIGLEVEGIKDYQEIKGNFEGLIVGEVIECSKHPNADRLKLTKVDVGSEILQIVCGAPNVDVNQKVVVATVGTTLYPLNGEKFKINNLLTKFLSFLISKRRFFYLDKILKNFIETCSKKRGEIKAELTAAKELTEKEINNIKEELTKNFSSKKKLNYKYDPSLIGGLIVQVGSTMVDTSIKNKLQKITNRMIEA